MDIVLLIARLGLAAVFAVAGAAKLMNVAGSRRAVQGFGMPAALAGPIGVALPVAELVIAVALIPRATAWWGAFGAAILLGAFVAGIGVSLAHGRAPDCHCFGQLHSEPVGPATLLRNGALIAVALLIVGFGWDNPGTSAVAWTGDLTTSEQIVALIMAAQTLAIAVGWWLTLHLLGQNGRLLHRMDEMEATLASGAKTHAPASMAPRGLPVGTPAPAFTLDDLDGQAVSLDTLRAAGKPVLAVFSDPNCGPCSMLTPDIARWQRDLAGSFTVAVIASGSAEANRARVADHAIERVLFDPERTVATLYESRGTPGAVMIRPDGTIGTPLATGVEEVRRLVPLAAVTPLPTVGSPAPAFALPDLTGKTVASRDLHGQNLLLLFWNPTCGFCKRMLPDLRAWLDDRSENDPEVVLVSNGSVEDNRAMGIDAPILLDAGFMTGRAFGARGTPAGILTAGDGTIASPMAVGGPAILELLAEATISRSRVSTA